MMGAFESQFDASALCDECAESFDHPNHGNGGAWPNHRFASIGARREVPKSAIDRVYDERTQTVIPPTPNDAMWGRALAAVRAVPPRGAGKQDRQGQAMAVLEMADRPLSSGAVVAIICAAEGRNAEEADALAITVAGALNRAASRHEAKRFKCRIRGARTSFCYEIVRPGGTVAEFPARPASPAPKADVAAAPASQQTRPERTPAEPNAYAAVLDSLQQRADRLNAELLGIANAIAVVERLAGLR